MNIPLVLLIASIPLQISAGKTGLAFTPSHLEVPAGSTLRLTFRNETPAGSQLEHTWVLVRPGTAQSVASAGTKAGSEHSYVPDSPDVIAHTGVVQPGESATIQFKAPTEPGSYPFICTNPGHYPSMQGTLEVKSTSVP